uniref:Odorant binding protein 12 n=1 Tax=Drosicha corpulenta TaxID=535978 RepID=A0A0U3UC81_9HEMI|nr:odorant binding protein 12 [Drosicha corpulenta]
MMKFICLIVLISFGTSALAEFRVEMLVAHGEQCGGTKDDLLKLSLYEISDTSTGKCMIDCMCKDVGIMDKNGKYNKDNLKTFIRSRWSEYDQYADKIADICEIELKDDAEEDECQYAYDVASCFAGQMRQKHFFDSLLEKVKQFHDKLKSGSYKTPDSVKQKLNEDLAQLKTLLQ